MTSPAIADGTAASASPRGVRKMKSFRCRPELWDSAIAKAGERGENLSDALERFLADYAAGAGYAAEPVADAIRTWTDEQLPAALAQAVASVTDALPADPTLIQQVAGIAVRRGETVRDVVTRACTGYVRRHGRR